MLVSVAAASGMLSAACAPGGGTGGEGDRPVYASVEELARASAGAFAVRIGRVVGRECDDGGEAREAEGPRGDAGADCVPMVFREATVEAVVLKPSGPAGGGRAVAVPARVVLGGVEKEAGGGRGPVAALASGAHMVVYARRLSPADHPGIDSVTGDLWIPTGGEQGLFDIEGKTVRARSALVTRLTARSPASDGGRLRATVGELRRAARART
ncbi:hypothetical protein [Streptomyces sp. NPDC007088]|uniref:hypothetical protein n=1 Tax=Streptomyces sp. NPDC007088 TaxID=3364773 RepID=UPI0036986D5F